MLVNQDSLHFRTGASEAASDKMVLSSAGVLTLSSGLVIPDAGTIGVASDTDAISIDSSGNVGIGIGDAAHPLDIYRGSGATYLKVKVGAAGDNAGLQINSGNGDAYAQILFGDDDDIDIGKIEYHAGTDSMIFTVNTATQLTIASTGIATFAGPVIGGTDTDTSNTGNVTLDFAANQNFVLTLTGNTTLVNPSTETIGQSGFITFIQDGTGGRTITLGTDYETAGGVGLALTSTASKTDIVPYVVIAANRILLGTPQLNFS